VLSVDEARELLSGIDVTSLVGLRDRALVALMVYTFARIGAAIKMRVEDVYIQGRRTWVRLHEKGGKRHEMPCHHSLEEYLDAYIKGAGIAADGKGYLFRTARGRSKELTDNPMSQADAYRMIRRRAAGVKILTKIGCHSFRATGITEYLRNGGMLAGGKGDVVDLLTNEYLIGSKSTNQLPPLKVPRPLKVPKSTTL